MIFKPRIAIIFKDSLIYFDNNFPSCYQIAAMLNRRWFLKQLPLAGVAGGWVMGSGGTGGNGIAGGPAGEAVGAERGVNRYGIRLRAGYPYPPGWAGRVTGRSFGTVGGALRAARGHRYPCHIFPVNDLETKPADAVTSQGGR